MNASDPDPAARHRAGLTALDRYYRDGHEEDLATAIAELRGGYDAAPAVDWACDLATALLDGHDRHGAAPQDRCLDQALDLLDRPEAASHPRGRTLLAHALLERYERDGTAGDHTRAVALQEEAVSDSAAGDTALDSAAVNLGISLAESSSPADIDRAVAILRAQVQATPADHLELGNRLTNLGNVLLRSSEREGHEPDLDRAIEFFERAAATPQRLAVDGYSWLGNLGNALAVRFESTGNAADLDRAIGLYRESVASCPPHSPQRAACLSNLANGLLDRYETAGDSRDCQEAIGHMRDTISATPAHGAFRGIRLSNLSTGLLDSFEATGDVDALDEAIGVCRQAVAVGAEDSADAARWHNNLGNALMAAHEVGRGGVLDEAIDAYTRAVERVPLTDRDRALYAGNLGTALIARQDEDSLRRAIDMFAQAVSLTRRGTPRHATWVNNLANGYTALHARTLSKADQRRAIRLYRAALRMTPSAAPEYAAWSFNLASESAARWRDLRIKRGTGRLRRLYRTTCALASETSAETALRAARSWALWAEDRRAWPEAAEAYRHATAALRTLLDNQLLMSHKHLWLTEALGLPARSAYAHARADDLDRAAMQIEHGRAVLLTEALDHAKLARLAALADDPLITRLHRLQAEARQLSMPAAAGPSAASAELADPEDTASWASATDAQIAERRRIQAELHQIAGEVRRSGGSSAAAAATEARHLPEPPNALAYLIPAERGGLALIIDRGTPPQIRAQWLPDLDTAIVKTRVDKLNYGYSEREHEQGQWRAVLDDTTRWLWSACIGPVLELIPAGATLTLVAAGQLEFLPLHAAWTPSGGGRRYAIDHAAISYAPNASALTAAARPATADTLLAVAEPQAAGLGALPFAETDVDVASFFISQAHRLAGAAATREAVLAALRGKSACHFACHAYARPASPMDSALVLADGPLELRDLISTEEDEDLLGSRLVVLDACETYVPGTGLPDEAISLATGFLQLGAAGVIATQWAVGGLAASLLKARFYREWRLSAMSPAQALTSAQRWLRDTTNAEKAEWLRPGGTNAELPRQVTRLLWREIIRRPPDAVEFAHPADWAAFTHTGT